MIKTLPITQARSKLTSMVDNAKRKLHEYVITVNGSPAAVIISAAEYEALTETHEILSNPELMKAIKKGEGDIKKGKVYDLDHLKKELKLASA